MAEYIMTNGYMYLSELVAKCKESGIRSRTVRATSTLLWVFELSDEDVVVLKLIFPKLVLKRYSTYKQYLIDYE